MTKSTLTPEERERRLAVLKDLTERLRGILAYGDILTHTRCMGHIEEHIFNGFDGLWIKGIPTRDTLLLERGVGARLRQDDHVNNIAASSVTHINRVPVEQWLDDEFRKTLEKHLNQTRVNISACGDWRSPADFPSG